MEVGRRPDNVPLRWESNGNAVSLKQVAKSSTESVNTLALPIDPPRNDLRFPDATAISPHQIQARQVTTKSDIIDELLEAFQRKRIAALRPNKGRVQCATIWRNGNYIIFNFVL